jgi:large subunit ribosomal protein L17
MLRNMCTSLFRSENGRIQTTLMKAKELRPFAEKLITLSKRETLHARRQVLRHIHDREVVDRLFDTLSARYAQRPGGYTRILKLGPRRGDNAELAVIELVGSDARPAKDETPPADTKKKAAKRKAPEAGGEDQGDVRKKKATKKKVASRKAAGESGAKKAPARGKTKKEAAATSTARKGSKKG